MTATKTVKHATNFRTNWKFGKVYADLLPRKDFIQFTPANPIILNIPFEVQFRDYEFSWIAYARVGLTLEIKNGSYIAYMSDGIKYVTMSGKPISEKGLNKLHSAFTCLGYSGADFAVRGMLNQIVSYYDYDFKGLAVNITKYLNSTKKQQQFVGWL